MLLILAHGERMFHTHVLPGPVFATFVALRAITGPRRACRRGPGADDVCPSIEAGAERVAKIFAVSLTSGTRLRAKTTGSGTANVPFDQRATAIVRQAVQDARSCGMALTYLAAEPGSSAQRVYTRLEFRDVATRAIRVHVL